MVDGPDFLQNYEGWKVKEEGWKVEEEGWKVEEVYIFSKVQFNELGLKK